MLDAKKFMAIYVFLCVFYICVSVKCVCKDIFTHRIVCSASAQAWF